jgi:hypothetical protein
MSGEVRNDAGWLPRGLSNERLWRDFGGGAADPRPGGRRAVMIATAYLSQANLPAKGATDLSDVDEAVAVLREAVAAAGPDHRVDAQRGLAAALSRRYERDA